MRSLAVHLALAACALGCRPERAVPEPPEPPARVTAPARLCGAPAPEEPCLAPEEVERWLRDPRLRILGAEEPPAGIQDTLVLTLSVPTARGPAVFRAKWRALSTTTRHNVPRKELVAYALQKRFLPPHAQVVPPTAGHCFALDHYRAEVDPEASPSAGGLSCVFGFLSYWMEDVVDLGTAADDGWFGHPHRALDPALRARNPVYRRSVAAANLLAYLIDHADSHPRQFVIRADAERPALYLVDNSMSFGAPQNTDLGDHDWSELLLRAYPRAPIARLRALGPEALAELAVIEEYRAEEGALVPAARRSAVPEDRREHGLRWVGRRLQVGMRASEIDALSVRLAVLQSRFEQGALRLE